VTDGLLTTLEVAEYLGVSPESVTRWWRAGELPGFRLASKVLRFRRSEIEAWLEQGRSTRGSTMLRAGDVARRPVKLS